MCAPAPSLLPPPLSHRHRPHRPHSHPARVGPHRHQAHRHPRLGPVTRHAASPPLHSSPESTEPSLRACHPHLPPPPPHTSPRARDLPPPPPSLPARACTSAVVGEVDEAEDGDMDWTAVVAEPLKPVVH